MTQQKCPTCGRSFDTLRGITSHHVQMHPDAWEERFWLWVEKGGPDECWEHQGSQTPWGHVLTQARGEGMEYVHRISYELHNEPPGDMQVNHHCDVANCVNPDHLYLGDQSDNIKDMWRRRRRHPDEMRGENGPNAILTEEQAAEIKRRLKTETISQVAKDYPVSESTIGSISAGDIWQSVGPGAEPTEL